MNKVESHKIVRETFENSFDKEKFIYFVKNLLNSFDDAPFVYRGNLIPDAYEKHINTFERIGKYSDGEFKIDILIVHLKKETSIERARSMQRNFIAWYLNGSRGNDLKDAALVAFVSPNSSDWRFSLVKMDYKFEEGNNGRMKVKEEFTPARRWSFLVGANENSHTAQSRLAPIMEDDKNNPVLKQLEDAFDIEKVTKEFFEKYRDLFLRVSDALNNVIENNQDVKKDFKEKNVSIADFSKKLLGQIVFLYFLQKKGWFGVPMNKTWGDGDKRFLRTLFGKAMSDGKNYFNDYLEPLFYEALAKERDDDFYSRFDCKIPFLNGGLFDPISNYDWVNTVIDLPDDLFSNTRVNLKTGDKGDGVLDMFDRYNFTVKEDEPLEKEVAIDPEMLGKVFENLLEVKDRKSKGTYYTPREIVHYMCEQSLVNYLTTELEGKVSKEDLEKLIKFGENVAEHEATYFAKKENDSDYKGSYKPNLSKSIEKFAKEIDEKLAAIKVCDPAIGSGAFPVGMMNEIVKTRLALNSYLTDSAAKQFRTAYNFKRDCIQNSLYGVDIDPGAVEIAKLRLWLSLVVDEEDIKQIKPLPNLDYKIVCGNSLLGVEKNLFNTGLFNELEELKPLFFNETSGSKKKEYKKQIEDIIAKLTNGRKDFDFEIYFSEVFHEKGGFDVVIANPPYDVYQGHRKNEIEELSHTVMYPLAKGGKLNAYKLFLAKSIQLQRANGILCEIFQNSFLADNSAKNIRKYFIERQKILQVDSFPERDDINRRVFENVKMSVCILLALNIELDDYPFVLNVWDDKYMSMGKKLELTKSNLIKLDGTNLAIPSASNAEMVILKRLAEFPKLIESGRCYEGEINLTFHKKYLRKEPIINAPMIKGAAVQKWYIKEKMSQGETEYLNILKFLKENSSPKTGHYLQKRLVMQGITGVDEKWRLKMTMLDSGTFCGNSANYILMNNNDVAYEYLLALLNSKLLNWYFKIFSTNSNVNGYEVNNLPVPRSSKMNQKPFINLVDQILKKKKDNPEADTRELEREIDEMVYELYGLSEEEIKIIEKI